jgi:outer membrane protein OmpA-like peptidoglycan-associated protein
MDVMNRLIGWASAGLAIAAATPAAAQSQAADKPDTIVCQLVDCDDAAPDAAAATDKPRQVRRGETRGFSLARPKSAPAASSAPAAASTPSRNVAVASNPSRPRPKSSAPKGQYDLRVQFMTGSDQVNPRSQAQISAFAAALKDPRLSTRRVRIEGHTDSTGTPAKNQDLSQRRAKAIADMLMADGVDITRLDVQGYGSSKPLPGTSASNGANRRVVAVLVN